MTLKATEETELNPRKPPCRRTLPQGNDPHAMLFRDIMSSTMTSRRGIQTLQYPQTTYSGQKIFLQYIFLFKKFRGDHHNSFKLECLV